LFNNQHVQPAEVLSQSLKQRHPAAGISALDARDFRFSNE